MAKLEIYKENREEIERLAKSNLLVPLNLREKINQILYLKKDNRTEYISTLELWEGKFLERVFAFKLDRRKKGLDQIIYKEVSRILEGNSDKLIKDLYFANMSGYHTLWTNKQSSYYSYYCDRTLNAEFRTTSQCYFNVGRYSYYCELNPNIEPMIINKKNWPYDFMKAKNFEYALGLDNSIVYCGYDKRNDGLYMLSDFMEYISWFRAFPQIEMYTKLNLLHLITDSRFYKKMSADMLYSFFFIYYFQ